MRNVREKLEQIQLSGCSEAKYIADLVDDIVDESEYNGDDELTCLGNIDSSLQEMADWIGSLRAAVAADISQHSGPQARKTCEE